MSESEVLRADDRRFEAMRKSDWAALDAALADDLTYVHSTARLESKKEHMDNLRAGKPHGHVLPLSQVGRESPGAERAQGEEIPVPHLDGPLG